MTVSDPWRLTRRDRAACVLALCELRALDKDYASEGVADAIDTLTDGLSLAFRIGTAAAVVATGLLGWGGSQRMLRARLALLLRAIMRADAGDYGRVEWRSPSALSGPVERLRRLSPLWERAAKTRTR